MLLYVLDTAIGNEKYDLITIIEADVQRRTRKV